MKCLYTRGSFPEIVYQINDAFGSITLIDAYMCLKKDRIV